MRNYIVNDFVGTLLNNCKVPKTEEIKESNTCKTTNINITINLEGIKKINRIEPFSLD